ncbi:MAG TPA: hypothetical protein VF937_05180, partial [Chloroflexota bacterium]
TRVFDAQARLVHDLAHRVAGGRWVALGGGGYDWVRVVPRSWASVWATMAGRALPEQLPEAWVSRWSDQARQHGFWPTPRLVLDEVGTWQPTPRRVDIERTNRARAEALRRLVLPALLRHGYPAYRIEAGPPGLPDLVSQTGGDAPESRVSSFETARGRLLLRDLCPASLIETLRPDAGLAAFTRRPEREHAILVRVASSGNGSVAVAHTETGIIVGQVVMSPAQDWWRELAGVYELSIETSRAWRRMGVARHLLQFCMQPRWIEQISLLAMGLDWHWDLADSELEVTAYRAMLRSLFEDVGFREVHTSEPNVAMHASNLLLVRVGGRVPAARQAALDEALFIPPWQRRATVAEGR